MRFTGMLYRGIHNHPGDRRKAEFKDMVKAGRVVQWRRDVLSYRAVKCTEFPTPRYAEQIARFMEIIAA